MATPSPTMITSQWVELYGASGIASLTSLLVSNDGAQTLFIATTDDANPPDDEVVGVAIYPLAQYIGDEGSVGVWAKTNNTKNTIATVQDNTAPAVRKYPKSTASLPAGIAMVGDSVNAIFEIVAKSYEIQNPNGIGISNDMPISFGAAQLPELDANGKFTADFSGQATLTVELAMQRGGNGGEAHLWVVAVINDDAISTQKFIIDNNKERIIYNFTVVENMLEGDEIQFFLYRDSSNNNDGGLYPALNNDGLPDAPSAFLEVSRLVIV